MRTITSLTSDPSQMVSELILHNEADLNHALVRNTFIAFDAKAILAIPLCTRPVDDFWTWSHDPKGVFSVRSAYHMLVRMKIRRETWLEGQGDSSNAETEQKKSWCNMWKD